MIPLDGGLEAARFYMRRPIADEVLVRSDPPVKYVDSDNPAIPEVWLRYGGLAVGTVTNGSPILGRLGNKQAWARMASLVSMGMVDGTQAPDGTTSTTPTFRALPDIPTGSLTVNGRQLEGPNEWRASDVVTRMVFPPEHLARYADYIAIAVTGRPATVDAAVIELLPPDQQVTAMVSMNGLYPRYDTWPAASAPSTPSI
jgi:hypothetical protein